MRKLLLGTALAFALVGLLAPVAHAGKIGVNAARNLKHYDNNGASCGVLVDDFLDYTVEAFCFGDGSTWFTVKVSGVPSHAIKSVNATGTGDCSGKKVTYKRKSGGVVIVRVVNNGSFDCTYKRVSVRW